MRGLSLLVLLFAIPASAQLPSVTDLDGGIYIPDLQNFGPVGLLPSPIPSPPLAGTYLGRDLYMFNTAPAISWFNTAFSLTAPGYSIYENNGGVLEVNTINTNGSNPQSECAFDFRNGGDFGCVGMIGASTLFVQGGLIDFNNPIGNTNEHYWWLQNTSSQTLALRLVDDTASVGPSLITFVRNGTKPVSVGIEGGATLNVSGSVDAGSVVVGGGTAITSSVQTLVTASLPHGRHCTDTQVIARGAVVSAGCVVGAPPSVDPEATWSCYVSEPDNVRLRLCCVSECCNEAPNTYSVRTIGP
jgi:hypothetical protein